jgi:hypothetical protein
VSAVTALRRTGGMLAVVSICGILPGSAFGSTLATKARGVTYGGSTSAGDPVVIVLSRHGTQVRRTYMQFVGKCSSGGVLPFFVTASARLPIGESGRIAATLISEQDLATGTKARETITLKGKVKGTRMSGSLRMHADIVDATGAAVDACDQAATFTAISARGKVFGGHTSQRAPIVVEIAANKKAVHRFRIGWESRCTPTGAVEPTGGFLVGDTLRNLPIARDRFGDDFTQNFPQPSGARETLDYLVRGKIDRGRVTGKFRVKSEVADATGTTLAQCDTGAISYTASSG